MKRVLLAMISAFAIHVYADDGSESNCHYNPEFRQTLEDHYREYSRKYEELKDQQTQCYDRCKLNAIKNSSSYYDCSYCRNGTLIIQADRMKLEWKHKLEDYDRETRNCR